MKKLVSLFCVLSMIFVIGGCTKEEVKEPSEIVLKDHLNREVILEKPAKTIVSSYYIPTTTLIALGAEDQLVGVEMKANEREIYQLAAPQLLDLPAMGNKKNFNIEECAKLQPDLVILPMSLKDYVAQLEELDIAVVVLNPETMDGFWDSVALLGKASGHDKKAKELHSYYEEQLSNIDEALEEVDVNKNVYFSSGSDLLMSATSTMFQSEIIKKAKGINIVDDLEGGNWSAIAAETLIKENPSYIFVENNSSSYIESLYQDARFNGLDAFKNKQVYTFPSNIDTWDTPAPSSILGIMWMSSILYPEMIDMEMVKEEAISFYDNFFGIEVSEEQLGL